MVPPKPTTVDEYLAAAPEAGRPLLTELRALLREVAPEATESLKWGQAAFEERRILFVFGAFKSHANFAPTRASLEIAADEIDAAALHRTKGILTLPYDRPLPVDIIRRVAEHRLVDVREHDARFTA
ncbi:MAG: DUF1801 domain-containing protein [Microbacteriaceae bacterium]|nr:DUF1801 domain-containing protein [Microbacteriaceae bacterium]